MTNEEIFHRQLINSYIRYAATSLFEEFMIRSELVNRTAEFLGMGQDAPQYARASAAIFFNGDKQAYEETFADVTNRATNHSYVIRTVEFGSTTIKEINLE